MNEFQIPEAYQKAAPPADAEDRIWQRIAEQAGQSRSHQKHPALRRAALIAASLALLAGLLTVGYATFIKWRLPEPKPYVPDESNGNIQIHAESTYSIPSGTSAPNTEGTGEASTEAAAPLSDEFFLNRALEILREAGVGDVDQTTVAVRRQKHLAWNREEVEVACSQKDTPISVTFDAERGVFLGMSGIDWVLSGTEACSTQAEADALARRYYEALPVSQGYQMASCEKYDEQFWSYDFCREVEPGLYSWYECVRISINPVSGRLTGCRVFFVPLLDDHQPEDVPLTEEEAKQLVEEKLPFVGGYKLVSVQKVVALPNWFFSETDSIDLQYASVSRLAWKLTYDNSGEFADKILVNVDLYTGEILGGDMVG